jgi:hypothetical protein
MFNNGHIIRANMSPMNFFIKVFNSITEFIVKCIYLVHILERLICKYLIFSYLYSLALYMSFLSNNY